ncbi:DNRLRE domain-containing protein [Streptomyces sp. NBC_00335]|uniref:DNRLRE domain-containing protein n=1 Tax=unclassified Streptomyces TaxID=2593676 RepID=UPI0022584933|nr:MULTISPECIES: DNRLRE domain-containing protein [unclassified Streptomyces]MCX5406603.1 DNRLRE domain-containing protein [Streptomyces sp. NBC_00086]
MHSSTSRPQGPVRATRRQGRGLAVPLALLLLAEGAIAATIAAPSLAAADSPAAGQRDTIARSAQDREETASRLTAQAQGRRIEVIGARTESTTLWANPDGTMTVESFAGPVRFRENGQWVPVDVTLVKDADGSVRSKAHPRGLRLAGRTGAAGGDLVSLGRGEQTVSLGWKGTLPEPVLQGAKATYENVLPATDLVVEATRTGFEQYLVVKERSAAERAASFTLPVRAKGIKATRGSDNSVSFADAKTGKAVGKLPTPFMWDASNDKTGQAGGHRAPVALDVVQRGEGFDLNVSADKGFLADADTEFPVTIDPAVYFGTNFDTFVRNGDTADNSGNVGLEVGRAWQKTEARSFINFPRNGSVTGQDILNAELNLYSVWSDSCEARSWEIWDTGTADAATRWSTQPTWRSKVTTSTQTYGHGDCGPRWLSEDITPLVKQWSQNSRTVDTVGLRATDEADNKAFKIFASADAPANAPSILVTYEAPADPVKDHVVYWNDVLQATYKAAGGAPGPLARAGAMVHGAIYDAANSARCAEGATKCLGAPYLTTATATNGALPDVNSAIDHAAYEVLKSVYPDPKYGFDAALATARSTIPAAVTSEQRAAGTEVGQKSAAAMIAARQNDGSAPIAPYTGSTVAGYWRPTGTGNGATPQWGTVKPFGMTSGSQFRPAGPAGHTVMGALLGSQPYTDQFNDVKSLGRADSTTRTADQTQAALFWANDLDGTYKPPGQLFEHTQILSRQQGLTVAGNAKLFALTAFAMADAAVTAWDAKYQTDIDLWRPESAVREDGDGNPNTVGDPNWQPLSQDRDGKHFSPPFPAYISGHATFAGAWAKVMQDWFGTDQMTWTGTTEDPNALGVTRTFTTFSAAATENAVGRVWLGVHYRWDGTDGVSAGGKAAGYVTANKLKANTAADWVKYEDLNNLGGCEAQGKRLVAEHRWTTYKCTQIAPPEPGHTLYVK